MRFTFSLETLLRHREDIEQRERDALLRLTYKFEMELTHRKKLEVKRLETMKELGLKQAENADSKELIWFCLYLKRLDQEVVECRKRLSQLQTDIQSQKNIVIEASKKRKILTAMKAKKLEAFRIALEKQEQKEVDELVVMRYATIGKQFTSAAHDSEDGKRV